MQVAGLLQSGNLADISYGGLRSTLQIVKLLFGEGLNCFNQSSALTHRLLVLRNVFESLDSRRFVASRDVRIFGERHDVGLGPRVKLSFLSTAIHHYLEWWLLR
jgi:hypothetical protein